MYKIVFFDVDGTLLSEVDRSLAASTKEAVTALIDKGIKVVVATGRPHNMCQSFLELGIDNIISANGALIKCKDETIHQSLLAPETVRELSEFAKLNGSGLSYFTDRLAMNGMGRQNERVQEALFETLGLTQYPDAMDSLVDEICCMCLYADDDEAGKYVEHFPTLRFERFHGYVLNVLEETKVCKSTAMRKVLEHYQIDASESIAFGDGGNDMDMLAAAGLGIAMGNAHDALKQQADFITKKSSEGGIDFALRKFGVI